MGDIILCTGDSGFCTPGEEKVRKTFTKYDEFTGIPYKVIEISGGRQFDSRNGRAIVGPSAYYILAI